ncbi:MAG: AmmeMemoRadiSam system protein B [Calditrichaeota bacterium]|nr:MAG: AmmeMemoRadiSam system protein B [Calditrichota bacterium]MBL1205885.1 AmmeMemoRadiSam system protein B [Calditrichota bacterium]
MFVKTRIYERMEKLIRQPGSAGKFYSKQKNILEREVAVFLESSKVEKEANNVYGLIVPNDELMVCGGVAARAYRQILDLDIDYVVVISTSLHTYFEEVSLFKGDAYSTPIGDVNIDKDLVWQLANSNDALISSTLGHEMDEHGIEIQLPFLQQVLYSFKLIPIIMGNQDSANIDALTTALSGALKGKNALIIASSNLSTHFSREKASVIDKNALDYIGNFDASKLNEEFQEGDIEMNGGGAVITAMNVCKNLGATKSKVLLYRNSGDMGNSTDQVTGYVSAMFYS